MRGEAPRAGTAAPWRAPLRALGLGCAVAAVAAATHLVATTAGAANVPGGQCPDTDGREEAVVGGEVLLTLTEFPSSQAKEGCVVGFILAPPETVMAVLRDAGSYQEYMPRVRRSEVSVGSGGVIFNRQELDLPFPIGDRHFTIRLHEERSDEGVHRLGFTYVKGSGNVVDTRGYWLIEPWREGSRVTYVLWSDPGGAIPKWAINRATRRTLPQVVTALRDRVLGRIAAAGGSELDARARP